MSSKQRLKKSKMLSNSKLLRDLSVGPWIGCSNKWFSTLWVTVCCRVSSNLGTSLYFNANLGQQYFICLLISHIKINPNVSLVYKNKMTYYYFFENYFFDDVFSWIHSGKMQYSVNSSLIKIRYQLPWHSKSYLNNIWRTSRENWVKMHEKVSWYGNHENNCKYHRTVLIYVWTL